jgi:charged multivesicular body protein 7
VSVVCSRTNPRVHAELTMTNSRNRLASLYADFTNQLSSNPDGYYYNVNTWKQALINASRAGVIPAQGNARHLLSIRTGEELARALQHPQYGRMTCLPAVFYDGVHKKDFMPLRDYMAAPTSIYKTSWIPSPWSVLQWGLRQVGVLGPPRVGETLKVGEFVVLGNVEMAGTRIIDRMQSHVSAVDRVLSKSEFLKQFADVLDQTATLSQSDMEILLVHLARDCLAISYDAQTIKFKSANDRLPTPITQEDTAIANLRDTIAKINAQLQPLEEQIAAQNARSREAVAKKQIVQAKAALRLKKMAESALQQRTDVALQLEGVYAQLQQAADQVEIVEAMKAGATALKSLNQKVGGAEGVAGVVDALREEMSTADEITNIINESSEQVDEGEIDDEFEALEMAEREKKQAEEKAAREKAEAEEAARTKARLAELEQLEKERKEKERKENEEEQKRIREASKPDRETEKQVEQASQSFAQMSFHEQPTTEDSADEQEETSVPA